MRGRAVAVGIVGGAVKGLAAITSTQGVVGSSEGVAEFTILFVSGEEEKMGLDGVYGWKATQALVQVGICGQKKRKKRTWWWWTGRATGELTC